MSSAICKYGSIGKRWDPASQGVSVRLLNPILDFLSIPNDFIFPRKLTDHLKGVLAGRGHLRAVGEELADWDCLLGWLLTFFLFLLDSGDVFLIVRL